MRIKTINQSVTRVLLCALALVTISILTAVGLAIVNHVQSQVEEDFSIGERVFQNAYAQQETQLFNSANILTSDFGFKRAVATAESETILSVLKNHGRRIDADLMALFSLDGTMRASTRDILSQISADSIQPLIRKTLHSDGQSIILVVDEHAYQVMLLSVKAPSPVGIALVGFELDEKFLKQLKLITNLDLALAAYTGDGVATEISSLEKFPNNFLDEVASEKVTFIDLLSVSERQLLIRTLPITADIVGADKLVVRLVKEKNKLLSEFRWLQLKIVAIGIVSLLFALIIGIVFSRRLTAPIVSLSNIAKHIAGGNYDTALEDTASTEEIASLGEAIHDMQSAIKVREEQVRYQASHDLLTDALNRHSFSSLIAEKVKTATYQQLFGFNILGFREFNDTFGTAVADACLNMLAARVRLLGGQVGRLNGAELVWMPEHLISEQDVHDIHHRLERPFEVEGTELAIKLCVASIAIPNDAESSEIAFRRLTVALDEAGTVPLRRCVYTEGMEDGYLQRLEVISALEEAIHDNGKGLSVHYQPKMKLPSREIHKVEALIRWQHEKLGHVPPDQFIVLAEKAGLVGHITHWVLKQVITDIVRWREQGWMINVAINLSVHDLSDPQLLAVIDARLSEAKLSREAVSFEITESDLMTDPVAATELLEAFQAHGFVLSIDDFGTGYSSLAYLKTMPVKELKIDRSFVTHMDSDEDDRQLVQTIIQLARQFDLSTVAEGVETAESLALLEQLGCDMVQGYFISRPLPGESLIEWLAEYTDGGFWGLRCAS